MTNQITELDWTRQEIEQAKAWLEDQGYNVKEEGWDDKYVMGLVRGGFMDN